MVPSDLLEGHCHWGHTSRVEEVPRRLALPAHSQTMELLEIQRKSVLIHHIGQHFLTLLLCYKIQKLRCIPGLPRTFWGGGCPGVRMLLGCRGFGGVWELPVDEEEEFEVKIAAGAELIC